MRVSYGAIAALALLGLGATPALGQSWRTENIARQRQGEQELDVRLRYAVGRFEIAPVAGNVLYSIGSRFDEEAFDLHSSYRRSDGTGRLRVRLEGIDSDIELSGLRDYELRAGQLELGLGDEITVSLDIELGAAEAELDLSGIRMKSLRYLTGASETRIRFGAKNPLKAERCEFKVGAASFTIESLGNANCRRFSLEGGAGTMTLDFSGEWHDDASGEIRVGLGTVEIRVPSDLGVRIERKTFLMSFDAPGFWKGDDAWVSPNWGEAAHKLELSVSGALGSIDVVRI